MDSALYYRATVYADLRTVDLQINRYADGFRCASKKKSLKIYNYKKMAAPGIEPGTLEYSNRCSTAKLSSQETILAEIAGSTGKFINDLKGKSFTF